MLPSDYAVIIPTHGRCDRVYTYDSLRKSGYTGPIYLLCDDGDKQLDQYKEKYGDKVLVFSKGDYAGRFDKMDNFGNKACVVYARNAMWDVAKKLGLTCFAVMDDDYTSLDYRITGEATYYARKMKNADSVFSAFVEFINSTKVSTICFAQGGDFIGGADNSQVRKGFEVSRKMMNVYFFHSDRQIEFKGTINEDLTSSISEGVVGNVLLTTRLCSITQKQTQQNAGGLTDIYLDFGTYVKSFYSVMYAPSCVRISAMGDSSKRIHHEVRWKYAVPKILREL